MISSLLSLVAWDHGSSRGSCRCYGVRSMCRDNDGRDRVMSFGGSFSPGGGRVEGGPGHDEGVAYLYRGGNEPDEVSRDISSLRRPDLY